MKKQEHGKRRHDSKNIGLTNIAPSTSFSTHPLVRCMKGKCDKRSIVKATYFSAFKILTLGLLSFLVEHRVMQCMLSEGTNFSELDLYQVISNKW